MTDVEASGWKWGWVLASAAAALLFACGGGKEAASGLPSFEPSFVERSCPGAKPLAFSLRETWENRASRDASCVPVPLPEGAERWETIPENQTTLPSILAIRIEGDRMQVVDCAFSSDGTASCGLTLSGSIRSDGSFSVRTSWGYWHGWLDRVTGTGWAKTCSESFPRDCTIEEFDRSRFSLRRRDARPRSAFGKTMILEFADGTAGALAVTDEDGVLRGQYLAGCVEGPVCGFGLQDGSFALNMAFRAVMVGNWDQSTDSGSGVLRPLFDPGTPEARSPFEIRGDRHLEQGYSAGRMGGVWDSEGEEPGAAWFAGESGGWVFAAGRGYRDMVITLDGRWEDGSSEIELRDYCAYRCSDIGNVYKLKLSEDGTALSGTLVSDNFRGATVSPVQWSRR